MSPKKLLSFLPALLLLAACNLPRGAATATPGLNPTQSYQTAIARVTQLYEQTRAAGSPTATPQPGEASATPPGSTPSATPAGPTAQPTLTPIPCDKAAPGNPIDVTIPDDTEMNPGQTFVKTWRLVNAGTCTWTDQYAVVWFSGAQIGDQDVVLLPGSVGPGQSVDISVPMTAPAEPGSYQSNWMLGNDAGVLFGIGEDGGSPFWVRIVVVPPSATPTATPTPSETLTETPAPTQTPAPAATPVVQAMGVVQLAVGDLLDLDNLLLNTGAGDDLDYSTNGGGDHLLTPVSGALLSVFGFSQPGYSDCQAGAQGGVALSVEEVGVGAFICYRTDAGRYGWMQISAFDMDTGALTLSALTWTLP